MIGYLSTPGRQHVGEVGGRQRHAFAGQHVLAVLVEFAGGAIEAERDLGARLVAGLLDRQHDQLDRFFMVGHRRREAAFVADRRGQAAFVQDLLQRVEHFGAVADRFLEARCADRDDHEFLDVQVVVGVRAAVDDVHHRHRHLHRAGAAEVAVQRQAGFFGGGLGHRHRHRQHGVGAEAALVFGAVQVDQGAVEEGLLVGVEAHDRFGDLGVDILAGLQHALAEVALHVAIAQFDRFARTGRRAGRHRRAAHHARLQQHIAFDGRIAARIDNFTADNINDSTHGSVSGRVKKWSARRQKNWGQVRHRPWPRFDPGCIRRSFAVRGSRPS